MADCYLTERQKDLLRSLVPGLQDGTVKTEWSYTYGGGVIMGIFGLDDQGELWRNVWKGITISDFDEFVACGFFNEKPNGAYTLRTQMIIDAVESNFGENDGSQKQVNPDGMLTVAPIWGLPIATRQFQCDVFMLMPFQANFRAMYTEHIKPVVQLLDLDIRLGDDFFSKHDIIREIWSAIYNSKFVIADCTGKNPNVFYELGIAHTLGKPAIMMAQDIDDIPFDVRSKRAIVYEHTALGIEAFDAKLKAAVISVLDDEYNE